MLDKNALRSIMVANGDTQATLAADMGISLSNLNAKINEYRGLQFSQFEIDFIRRRYDLSAGDVVRIFFCSSIILKRQLRRGARV